MVPRSRAPRHRLRGRSPAGRARPHRRRSTTAAGRSPSIRASSSTTSGTTRTSCGCSTTSGCRPSRATCRSRSRRVAGRSSTRRARSGCSRSRPTWRVAATCGWSPTSCGSHARHPLPPPSATGETTRELLDRMALSEEFRRDFLLPVIACIWSSSLEAMLEYPARSMIAFLDNHGLLDVLQRPRWRTVTRREPRVRRDACPRRWLERRAAAPPRWSGSCGAPTVSRGRRARRGCGRVRPRRPCDARRHIAADPGRRRRPNEREVLSAFRYQENIAVLHRDSVASCRPSTRLVELELPLGRTSLGRERERVSLSYWMNRLQNLRDRAAGDRDAESGARAAVGRARRDLSPPTVRRRGHRAPMRGCRRSRACGGPGSAGATAGTGSTRTA